MQREDGASAAPAAGGDGGKGLEPSAAFNESKDLEAAGEATETPAATSELSFMEQIRVNICEAARMGRWGALVSLICGVALIALYYGYTPAKPHFEWIEAKKREHGILYSMVSTSLFGGVLPSFMMLATGQLKRPWWAHALFNTVFWIVVGAAIDGIFRLQVFLHGEGNDAGTVIRKVLFDQFVWTPFVAIPCFTLLLRWRDRDFSFKRCAEIVQPREFFIQCIGTTISSWCVWNLAFAVVYSFPTELQIPVHNFINFAWAILLSLLSRQSSREDAEALPGRQ